MKNPSETKQKTPAVSGRKKRRKKLNTRDKVYIILLTAFIIATAVVFSLVVIDFNSPNDLVFLTENIAEETAQPEAFWQEPPPLTPAEPHTITAASPPAQTPAERAAPEAIPAAWLPSERDFPEKPLRRGTLVFVIDDAGNNLRDLEPFLNLGIPMTIAVLPGLPDSAEAARRVRDAGLEVFLHQPMESLAGHNPGPGAIWADMGQDEIRDIVSRNLDELWPVTGLNNHEGSRVTMDDEAMEAVLSLALERGINFLDSRTTAESAAPRVARRLGMEIGERDIFIDNNPERESMKSFIKRGLDRAEQNGSAIMIGHVFSAALAPLLADMIPELTKQGFSFATVSQLINGDG